MSVPAPDTGIRFSPPHFAYDMFEWLWFVRERGLAASVREGWSSQIVDPDRIFSLGRVRYESRSSSSIETILELDRAAMQIRLHFSRGRIDVTIAFEPGETKESDRLLEQLRELFPPLGATTDETPIGFWHMALSANKTVRSMRLDEWGTSAGNYPSRVRASLDRLMATVKPEQRGQLILWHGEPGTGKTWALSALARAWRRWCWFEYVTDPEMLLGKAEYLTEVLMAGDARYAPGNEGEAEPWRLLILEDSGELLVPDAKEKEGQRLSRLLNVVDGFIGRGMRLLVLVTTNERVSDLHTAVSRPGRCLQVLEFEPFNRVEANAWLRENGYAGPELTASATLADLYAVLRGEEPAAPTRPVGFQVG